MNGWPKPGDEELVLSVVHTAFANLLDAVPAEHKVAVVRKMRGELDGVLRELDGLPGHGDHTDHGQCGACPECGCCDRCGTECDCTGQPGCAATGCACPEFAPLAADRAGAPTGTGPTTFVAPRPAEKAGTGTGGDAA